MLPKLNQVINFLEDENIAVNLKVREQSNSWTIQFNEPWTDDTKRRCGITYKFNKKQNKYNIVFNSFKATAILGDEYKGSFWQFVKLLKQFDSISEAKMYFMKNYMLLSDMLTNENYNYEDEEKNVVNNKLELPKGSKKFDKNKHDKYYQYLLKRNITDKIIDSKKIFINEDLQRIIFPVYRENNLIFYTARAINKFYFPSWLKSNGKDIYPIWNLENVNGAEINIFEGIFDALVVQNGVAILGAANHTKNYTQQLIDKNYLQINIILDNDIAGINGKIAMAKELLKGGYKNIYVYNFKGIKEKDFSLMAKHNIPFQFNKRLMKWGMNIEVAIKMKIFK